MRKILSLLILTILITSCHQKQTDDTSYSVADMEAEVVPITQQSSNVPVSLVDVTVKQNVIKKRIIKDGRLGLRVSELEDAKFRIDTLIKKHGGYYENESFNNLDQESSFTLKIRIPSANFEKFISDVEIGDGEILYKEVDARDVTDQFIDLET